MKAKLLVAGVLLLVSSITFAQSKYGIRKISSFFIQRQPGNIPVDSAGNPVILHPDTIYTVYVETSGTAVKWVAAWKDDKTFSVIASVVKDRPFDVGTNQMTNQKVVLRPAKGNKLWQLQFEKRDSLSRPPVRPKRGEMILQVRWGGKLFILKIGASTELEAMPSV